MEANTILERAEILINGHFVLASGRHTDTYFNKDILFADTEATSEICRMIAERFSQLKIDAVIGPAVGGAIITQWVAYHLTKLTGRKVFATYAKGAGLISTIKRGYDRIIARKRILVVDDCATTGVSVMSVVNAVRDCGGEAVAVGIISNQSAFAMENLARADIPIIFALTTTLIDTWSKEDCKLCRDGIPVNADVGRGTDLLAAKGATQPSAS